MPDEEFDMREDEYVEPPQAASIKVGVAYKVVASRLPDAFFDNEEEAMDFAKALCYEAPGNVTVHKVIPHHYFIFSRYRDGKKVI